MGWRPCLASWIDRVYLHETEEGEETKQGIDEECSPEQLPLQIRAEGCEIIQNLMNWLIDPAICFVRKQCHKIVDCLDQTLVVGTLRLLECLLTDIVRRAAQQALLLQREESDGRVEEEVDSRVEEGVPQQVEEERLAGGDGLQVADDLEPADRDLREEERRHPHHPHHQADAQLVRSLGTIPLYRPPEVAGGAWEADWEC